VVVDQNADAAGAGGATTSTSGPSSSSSTGASVSSSTSSGQGGSFQVVISDTPKVFLDCMPVVAPDPVEASIDVTYDNTQGSAAAEAFIAGARLAMTGAAGSLTWSFQLEPSGSGPVQPGVALQQTHQKVPGSGSGRGTGAPCDYCGDQGEFELDVKDPDGAFTIGFGVTVGCAF